MALDVLVFVSKRLQPVVAALIVLAFVQLLAAEKTESPPVVRVHIQR